MNTNYNAKNMRMLQAAALAAICLLHCHMALAQREVTVVDMETKLPIGGAIMLVDNKPSCEHRANYRGQLTVPDSAQCIVLGYPGYDTHKFLATEMTDTLELMRSYKGIREVVVMGKKRTVSPYILKDINDLAKQMKQEVGVTAGVAFSFFDLFTAKKRKRTRERIAAIENY